MANDLTAMLETKRDIEAKTNDLFGGRWIIEKRIKNPDPLAEPSITEIETWWKFQIPNIESDVKLTEEEITAINAVALSASSRIPGVYATKISTKLK